MGDFYKYGAIAAMKKFHSIILMGLMVHFLPLNAETFQEEPLTFIDQMEEPTLATMEEELALLDEEFEEFEEDLAFIGNTIEEEANVISAAAQQITPVIDLQEELKEPVFEKADSLALIENAPPAEQVVEKTDTLALIENVPVVELVHNETNELALIEKTPVEQDSAKEIVNNETNELAFLEKTPVASTETALKEEELVQEAPATYNVREVSMVEKQPAAKSDAISVDLEQAFSGAPIIYSLLLAMSVFSVCIWLYSILSMSSSAKIPHFLLKNVQNKLNSNNFDEALTLCQENKSLFCKMVTTGILSRRHGLPVMIETMKAEGKRSTISSWQKLGLLNDIAVIAPMLGLLGTVLGMFYAFYDLNRSIESISSLFDGLGVSVGTTVAGLIVAILALILHSTAKYRLVKMLARVENEAQSVAMLIDDRTSILKG